jgi:CHAD domain-containing protein
VQAVPPRKEIKIAPDQPAKAAFQSIASACLAQIVANKPAILAGDPEGVHLMRVGLRRLRTAISLFADIVADARMPAIRRELKWLSDELGPAREFEVFLTRVVAPLGQQHTRLSGMRTLSRDLADQREAAVARAVAAVSSPRFRELTRTAAAWIETGGWRQPRSKLARERGEQPIETVARAQLKRRWKQIRKHGRRLAHLDPGARHELRIRAKKLRYATEFYKTVFAGKKQAKRRAAFLTALKPLQECLGELNDIFVHEKLTNGIVQASAIRKAGQPRQVAAAGLLTSHEEARFKPLLTAAEHAFGTFEKLDPYWK